MVTLSMPFYDAHSFIMVLPYIQAFNLETESARCIGYSPRNLLIPSEVYPFQHQQAVSEVTLKGKLSAPKKTIWAQIKFGVIRSMHVVTTNFQNILPQCVGVPLRINRLSSAKTS